MLICFYIKAWCYKYDEQNTDELEKFEIISGKDMKRSLSNKFVKPFHLLSQVEYKHLNIINEEDCYLG